MERGGWTLVLAALLVAGASRTQAQTAVVVDDFESGKAWRQVAGRECIEASLAPAEGKAHAGRRAGRASIRLKQAGGWVEFVGGSPARVEDPAMRLRLFAHPGSASATLTLRILDAKRETFQSARFALTPGGGWQEIAVPLDTTAFRESWPSGGTKDGVIDFPVTFQSLVFSGTLEAEGILIDDIAFLPGEGRERTRTVVADFEGPRVTAACAWGLKVRREGCAAEVREGEAASGRRALALTVDAAEPGGAAEFALRIDPAPRHERILRVTARVLPPAPGWRLTWRLRDSGGETFQGPAVPVPAAGEWQEVGSEVTAESFREHWGGPNDGKHDHPLFIQSIVLTAPAAGVATVLVDDVAVEEDLPASEVMTASLSTGRLANRFDPGEEVALDLALRNRSAARTHAGTARVAVTDFDGKEMFRREVPYSLAPGTGRTESVRFRPPDPGFYRPTVTLVEEGREHVAATSGVAVFASAAGQPRQGRIFFGMNAHLDRLDAEHLRREVQLMEEMGVEAARVGVSWGAIEPKEGEFDPSRLDRILEALARADIEPAVLIAYTAKWATTGDPNAQDWHQWHNAPPRVDAYAAHASRLAARYRGRVRFYEIWNEPDIGFWLGTSAQYNDLLKAAYRAIRAADPKAQVMNGGFSETKRRPTFVPEVLAGCRDSFDIYAFHTHGGFGNILVAEADTRRYLEGFPKRPVWLNEAGYASVGAGGEIAQAEALVQKVVFAAAQGWANYMWYDLRDDGTDPGDWEHNYGLVKRDYTPKPAYVAYAHLIGALSGQRFTGPLKGAPEDVYAYRFAGEGGATAVLWRRPGVPGETLVTLDAPAGTVVRGLVGQPLPALAQGGTLTVPVGARPLFVVAKNPAASFAVRPSFITWPRAASVRGQGAVEVALRNPLAGRLTGTVDAVCEDADAWEVAPAALPFDLATGAGTTLTFTLRGKAGGQERLHSALRLRVRTGGSALGEITGRVAIRAVVPVRPLVPGAEGALPAGAFLPPALERREQVTELLAAAAMDRQDWKGPADLSARVSAAWTPEALLIEVKADDDVPSWAGAAADMWQADSLQVGIKVPEQQGFHELGLALIAGRPAVYRWHGPDAKPGPETGVSGTVVREGGTTRYRLTIPAPALGLERFTPGQRLALAALVNDSDGAGRKQWVEWAGGIGKQKDPDRFATVELVEE